MEFKNKVFVLTGYRYFPDYKAQLVEKIKALGGIVEDKLSEDSSYLILSDSDQCEWDQSEIDKVDTLLDNGVFISLTTEKRC